MWFRIIVFLIILSAIDDYWEEKAKKQRYKKRKCRFFKSATYFFITAIMLLVSNYLGEEVYSYIALGILIGIGTFLSAINPNLREMYTAILVFGTIIGIVSFYYEKHRIIFSLVDIWMLLSIIVAMKESIHNMRYGIDPDVIEEQKAAKKRFKKRLRLFKTAFKMWRWR